MSSLLKAAAPLAEQRTLLGALTRELSRSISRFGKDSDGLLLEAFAPSHKLKEEAERVARLFEQGAPPVPPLQQRLRALARLRAGDPGLTRRDWILITWGLCDDMDACGKAIEEQAMFDAVMAHTDGWIARSDVPRKGWFGLLNSYFSYDIDQEDASQNWLQLRGQLVVTMPILVGSLRSPKLWTRMLEEHTDIFTDQAGLSFREIMFHGSSADHERLGNGLPIPESSWLWRRVVAHQIAHMNAMPDTQFVELIAPMTAFLRTKPLFADDILAAMLTRYCLSAQRDESHDVLKLESFARWGNPQLRNAARWSKVEGPVRAMVLRWFAKEDLEHFFSLLQGDGQVDQARLHYWLRFVDQISYTRIVLGADAVSNQHPEFRNFREKNAKRYGQLVGGPTHNNAFIMRIGDHYFVEFSGTGNACYAYEDAQLPFDPDSKFLHSANDLKKKISTSHYSDNRILHNGGWEWKADEFLARRDIRPGETAGSKSVAVTAYQPQYVAHPGSHRPAEARPSPQPPRRKPHSALVDNAAKLVPTTVAGAVRIATELARINGVPTVDNRDQGGAFWVQTNKLGSAIGRELTRLGMQFNPGKGFWIK
jgi:hypothetical protein